MASAQIQHVFVLMLENHSFDNIFALSGISGIQHASSSNCNSYAGNTYCVGPGAPASMPTDPGHEFPDVVEQLGGAGAAFVKGQPYPPINNSGFAANYATTTTEGPAPPPQDIGDIMKCFETSADLPAIYALATGFAICDHWYSSLPGPTWPNRYFVHGASSAGLDHSPSDTEMAWWESPFSNGFEYPNGSIFDALKAKGIPFQIYHDMSGPAVGALPQSLSIHNLKYDQNFRPMSSFASDLSSGYTAAYTFLEPNYGWITSNYEDGSSQHPQDSVAGGEGLIQTVYEAIRNSPVWPNSLLIITYDEHGGFYDSVAPVAGVPPNDGSNNSSLNEYGFQFDQLGVRVPAVIVSPWIPAGTVCSNQFDHTSVLATVERLFGVNPLTARDQAANDVLSLLTETSARTDCPVTIPAAQPVSALPLATEESVRDRETGPIPERGTLPGFLAIAHKLHRELAAGTGEDISAIQDRFQALRTRAEARAYIEDVLSRLPGSAAVTA